MKHLLLFLVIFLVACSASPVQKITSYEDLIQVDDLLPGDEIAFPLEISGKARGYWYFEATFPIVLEDEDGTILLQTYATAQDEWMTEEFVPFTVIIKKPVTSAHSGKLIFKYSNASGLPEKEDQLIIPVRF